MKKINLEIEIETELVSTVINEISKYFEQKYANSFRIQRLEIIIE